MFRLGCSIAKSVALKPRPLPLPANSLLPRASLFHRSPFSSSLFSSPFSFSAFRATRSPLNASSSHNPLIRRFSSLGDKHPRFSAAAQNIIDKRAIAMKRYRVFVLMTAAFLLLWFWYVKRDKLMDFLPLRGISRAWGWLHTHDIPQSMRAPIYRWWLKTFEGNEDEAGAPLESYKNLQEFFIRHLKPGVRTIDQSAAIVSPVDGRITVFGPVVNRRIEQVKGMSFAMTDFLGFMPNAENLHYCVLYLCPGDYHRIHSPADVSVFTRQHFPGKLYPVAPEYCYYIPHLFAQNERVVLRGEWQHGFFSMSPVGALNVGSIVLNHDPDVLTNLPSHKPGEQYSVNTPLPYGPSRPLASFFREYPASQPLKLQRGEEFARFQMGSTVVLVFEVKDGDVEWTVKGNDKIKLGQPLVRVVPKGTAKASPVSAPVTGTSPAASPVVAAPGSAVAIAATAAAASAAGAVSSSDKDKK